MAYTKLGTCMVLGHVDGDEHRAALARIAELEALLREAEVHLGGYMGSRYSDVEALRCRIHKATSVK